MFTKIKDILLIQLDQLLINEIKIIHDNLSSFSSEDAHKLIVSLTAMYYSVKCEETFKFSKNSDSFDWNAFFLNIENKSDADLLEVIKGLLEI